MERKAACGFSRWICNGFPNRIPSSVTGLSVSGRRPKQKAECPDLRLLMTMVRRLEL
jgi:hypothetical protein